MQKVARNEQSQKSPKSCQATCEKPFIFPSTKQRQNNQGKRRSTLFFCGGSWKSRFEWLEKSSLKFFLNFSYEEELTVSFIPLCQAVHQAMQSMGGFKINIFGMIPVSLEMKVFVFTAVWARLNNTHTFGHWVIFSGHRHPPPTPPPPPL